MKKISFLIFLVSILFGCNNADNSEKKERVAKGDVFYGGVLRINEVEDFRNLFPQAVSEVTSWHIVSNIYEGLVKLNQKDLSIMPAIAKSWEINESATTYTFHLRKGVKFHDDECFESGEGRELTAADVKYCFDKVCSADSDNKGFWVFENKVKGADEYYKSSKSKNNLPGGVSGFKVINDSTFVIELNYPFSGLMNLLSTPYCSVFPKEAFEKYGVEMRTRCVGTGPFKVKEVKEGQAVILVRNDNYWDTDKFGNQLPYLDAIQCSFIKEKKSELLEFKKGNLDLVFRLPLEMIGDVVGELEEAQSGGNPSFEMQVMPSLSICYYGFQHNSEIFKNKKVRQAFNCAVDKDAIVNFTMQGDGIPAKYGIVPTCFKDYNTASLSGYKFNPDLARKYLAEAGFPGGKGFPELTLDLNSGGGRNVQIAEVVQKMLNENLGIKIKLNTLPLAQHLEQVESGKSIFFRVAWQADYPDPENFLNGFYGKNIPENPSDRSYINACRYSNAAFDSLFETAQRTQDVKLRNELLLKADKIQLEDAAVLPIYYEENTRLVQLNVRNFDQNAMEYRDYSRVYFQKEKKKKDSTNTEVTNSN